MSQALFALTTNGNIEIFWNKEIDLGVPHNRPDVVVVDKEKKKWTLIDFSVPWDGNVKSKEDDKITKYAPLEAKIQESFHVQTESIPIIVGALGTIPLRLLGFLKAIGLPDVGESKKFGDIKPDFGNFLKS